MGSFFLPLASIIKFKLKSIPLFSVHRSSGILIPLLYGSASCTCVRGWDQAMILLFQLFFSLLIKLPVHVLLLMYLAMTYFTLTWLSFKQHLVEQDTKIISEELIQCEDCVWPTHTAGNHVYVKTFNSSLVPN